MTDTNTGHGNTGDCNTGDYNTGHWNTGDCNTGDYNTGHWNTGHWNTGSCNTGHRNIGDWNTANNETGHFNTIQSDTVRVFNKDCKIVDFENADKPYFIYNLILTDWIYESDMSETEKRHNQTYKTTGGYLKVYTYKEACRNAWDKADEEDRKKLWNIPNFDPEVFKEISGIDVTQEDTEEMTMEEVCKALGKTIKIKK